MKRVLFSILVASITVLGSMGIASQATIAQNGEDKLGAYQLEAETYPGRGTVFNLVYRTYNDLAKVAGPSYTLVAGIFRVGQPFDMFQSGTNYYIVDPGDDTPGNLYGQNRPGRIFLWNRTTGLCSEEAIAEGQNPADYERIWTAGRMNGTFFIVNDKGELKSYVPATNVWTVLATGISTFGTEADLVVRAPNLVYYTDYQRGHIWRYDTSTSTNSIFATVVDYPVSITMDGANIVVLGKLVGTNTIYKFAPAGGLPIQQRTFTNSNLRGLGRVSATDYVTNDAWSHNIVRIKIVGTSAPILISESVGGQIQAVSMGRDLNNNDVVGFADFAGKRIGETMLAP